MPYQVIRQDITKMEVDAIVNAANTALQMGGGVCGAIFEAAGAKELQAACRKLGVIQTGEAVLTPGFKLPAKYVIHAAGPVYDPSNKTNCRQQLYAAYMNSLLLAAENQCVSIAFPLISSGIYGYPKDEALEVATQAIRDYLAGHDMEVYLCVFSRAAFAVSEDLLGEVRSYIDSHYVEEHFHERRKYLQVELQALAQDRSDEMLTVGASPSPNAGAYDSLDDLIGHLDEPFSVTLLSLIDAKGLSDPEVYKKANIDRKLFSKIRAGHGYTPRKPTILALAIALKLTLRETTDLLKRAGYAFSHASKFDVVVEYFIENEKYDIFEINNVLFSYDLPLLGG